VNGYKRCFARFTEQDESSLQLLVIAESRRIEFSRHWKLSLDAGFANSIGREVM